MGKYFANILQAIWTPLLGMRLTWRHLFMPSVTIQYPDERWELPPSSRMQLFVNMVKALPEDVKETSTGHKIRLHVTKFDIDMAKCCYCNLCTIPCPTECIYMTPSFEDSAPDRFDLIYHFAKLSPQEAAALEEKARQADAAEAAQKAARQRDRETATVSTAGA
jgi:NADH-quinone oxidoreductase subunit I